MSRLYDNAGYINIPGILARKTPFIFVAGGRGTGKTYGALKTVQEEERKFLFLRRTQGQADIISKPDFSPFKKICEDTGQKISTFPLTKYNSAFCYYDENEDGKAVPYGQPLGYTAALSTFSNIRGFDASDVDIIIYDEFIPERHERPIKNEFEALMNCYETVSRNRELNGKPPVQLLCLANANDMGNPVFMGLNLVKRAMRMMSTGQEFFHDEKRGIDLYILQRSPISEAKKDTALYRLSEGTSFFDMSVGNKFAFDTPGNIRSENLKQYTPIVNVGELCIYRHKSESRYYITTHSSGTPETYTAGESDLQRFKAKYGWLWAAYLRNMTIFEDYTCEILLTKYLK